MRGSERYHFLNIEAPGMSVLLHATWQVISNFLTAHFSHLAEEFEASRLTTSVAPLEETNINLPESGIELAEIEPTPPAFDPKAKFKKAFGISDFDLAIQLVLKDREEKSEKQKTASWGDCILSFFSRSKPKPYPLFRNIIHLHFLRSNLFLALIEFQQVVSFYEDPFNVVENIESIELELTEKGNRAMVALVELMAYLMNISKNNIQKKEQWINIPTAEKLASGNWKLNENRQMRLQYFTKPLPGDKASIELIEDIKRLVLENQFMYFYHLNPNLLFYINDKCDSAVKKAKNFNHAQLERLMPELQIQTELRLALNTSENKRAQMEEINKLHESQHEADQKTILNLSDQIVEKCHENLALMSQIEELKLKLAKPDDCNKSDSRKPKF